MTNGTRVPVGEPSGVSFDDPDRQLAERALGNRPFSGYALTRCLRKKRSELATSNAGTSMWRPGFACSVFS